LPSVIDGTALEAAVNDTLADYLSWTATSGTLIDDIATDFSNWLAQPAVQAQVAADFNSMVDLNALLAPFENALQSYLEQVMQAYMMALMSALQSQITSGFEQAMSGFSASMAEAMNIDPEQFEAAFADAFTINMDEDDFTELLTSLLNNEENSYEGNLRRLSFADFAVPTSISIYPIDFESKQSVIDILDGYNAEMEATGQDDRVITYTDLVGTLMSSVTDIVNMISYVLVAFVAISLFVSSIMIGVITYISVLERKKEIGILRSLGARKLDISNVFNAETLIVGLVAGCMGIGITLLATIPANAIVYANFDVANIAILPPLPALALIGISMALTFIAGLIPSSAASRRDPVEALRSE
jgi:ABC-type antimicrobial peptide transport system permease subunit